MANFDPAFDKMIRNEGGFKITHIENKRAELIEANERARIELGAV